MHIFHPAKDTRTAEAPETAKQMILAATSFLGDLKPEQRRRAVFNVGA